MGLISRVSSRTYRSLQKVTNPHLSNMQIFVKTSNATNTLEVESQEQLVQQICQLENAFPEQLILSKNFEELVEGATVDVTGRVLGGKVHGSLARAGKVKGQTPKVDKEEKKKPKTGRARRRQQYNRRFVTAVATFGKRRGPNAQEAK